MVAKKDLAEDTRREELRLWKVDFRVWLEERLKGLEDGLQEIKRANEKFAEVLYQGNGKESLCEEVHRHSRFVEEHEEEKKERSRQLRAARLSLYGSLVLLVLNVIVTLALGHVR